MLNVSLRNICLYSIIKWELCNSNKSQKCTHKVIEYNLEQWENDKFPILNLYRSTCNKLFVWIENPIWASIQKKDITSQWGIFVLLWRSSQKPLNHLNVSLHRII
jgi:hypothetical protein